MFIIEACHFLFFLPLFGGLDDRQEVTMSSFSLFFVIHISLGKRASICTLECFLFLVLFFLSFTGHILHSVRHCCLWISLDCTFHFIS